MVVRKYTEKEGRDPKKLLGIDESIIPFKYFTGIYTDENIIFTDDLFGINFRVLPYQGVIFDRMYNDIDLDSYVLPKDLKDKKWMLVGSHFVAENQDFFSETSQVLLTVKGDDVINKRIQERYESGEQGLLEESKKVYNKKGDWMQSYVSFDTEREEKLINKIHYHADFVYRKYGWLPWERREMKLRANKEMLDRIEEEVLKPILASLFYIESTEGMKINNAMLMGIGKIFFEEDPSVKGIIITKQDEEV